MPDKPDHELAIDAANHAGDLEVLIETAGYYRLAPSDAERIVDDVQTAVRGWERLAAAANLGPDEMDTIREAIAA